MADYRNLDKITITDLTFYAYHGVFDFEKEKGQIFSVNAELWLDALGAAKSDDLTQSVNYGAVCDLIVAFLTEHTYDLLEAAVYHAMREVMLSFPRIQHMKMELCKPHAPIEHSFGNVSVTMELGWHKAYIALGSNLGDRSAYIDGAIESLQKDTDFREITVSQMIETEPYGGVEQGKFINGALSCETLLSPMELLARLHEIEAAADRKREIHWGPRTLDLDIIMYDDLVISSEMLIVPHPDMLERDFVMKPLAEIAGYRLHPIEKKTIEKLASKIDSQYIKQ